MSETTDPTAGERPRCDTCSDTGRIPWMSEGDPNFYQEPDSEGMLPCPDCTPAEPDAGADPTAGEREGSRLRCTSCGAWGHLNDPCPAEPDAGDVEALTDHERRVILSRVPLAQGRDDDEIIASVEHVLATRLDAVRRKAGDERAEEIAHAIEAADPCEGSPVYDEAARIARESR